jgi:hypothetical protein
MGDRKKEVCKRGHRLEPSNGNYIHDYSDQGES